MTNFSTIHLTDQLKALEPGDIVVTDTGAHLPISMVDGRVILVNIYAGVSVAMHSDEFNYITRVIRPGEKREVPEIVGWLRNAVSLTEEYLEVPENAGKEMVVGSKGLCTIMTKLADHFEQDARK